MKFQLLAFFLLITTFSFTQNTTKTKNNEDVSKIINTLVTNLSQDAENPLKIDQTYLANLAQLLPEGILKQTIAGYSSNLGSDPNLTYRQIYWDLSASLAQNPQLANKPQFENTKLGLDVMFNNSELLASAFKSKGIDYTPGMFINNEKLIGELTNVTGSLANAKAIGAGVELVAVFIKLLEQNQKNKEDYKKLAKISGTTLYIEKDPAMTSSLIDAYLGIEEGQMITTLYRYDFANGASLRVENGILKYFNSKKNISKELVSVDKKHDYTHYGINDIKAFDDTHFASISISPDETFFYLNTGWKVISEKKTNGLKRETNYFFNSEDGSSLNIKTPDYSSDKNEVLTASYINNELQFWDFNPKKLTLAETKYNITTNTISTNEFNLKNEKFFFIGDNNNFINSLKKSMGRTYPSLVNNYTPYYHAVDADSSSIVLIWGNYRNNGSQSKDAKMYTSSMLQIASKKEVGSTSVLVNEFTGLTSSKKKGVFFINNKGELGHFQLKPSIITAEQLLSELKNASKYKIAESYDFIFDQEYSSKLGYASKDLTDDNIGLPILKFSPDENWLIYIQKDFLYVINPISFELIKKIRLNSSPSNLFFTKENSEWVLHLQSRNEFSFPVTKKYSLEKLIKFENRTPDQKMTAQNNKPVVKETESPVINSGTSLADEIKKLKGLMDEGVITKDEFAAAKKKLLDNSNTLSNVPTDKKGKAVLNDSPYSKWLFVQSDKPIQVRYQTMTEQDGITYYKIQFRLNSNDSIFCRRPECKGYILTWGFPDLQGRDYIYRHFKFFNSYDDIYTIPDSIPLRTRFNDGSTRFLKNDGFYYTTKQNEEQKADLFYNCVDNILENNSKTRCAGSGSWRNIYKEERALELK